MGIGQKPGQQLSFKYLDIIAAFFVAILIISNIASSAKIVDLGFSLFTIPLAFDGGTLLFPLAYIIGDILTEVYGFKMSRRVIWTGFGALVFASLIFRLLKVLPPEAVWEKNTTSAAYNAVLGGMCSGGIVIASLTAYFVGEFSNAVILSRVKILMKGKHLWVRAISSSIVGELLDSLIFISIATLAKVFPPEIFWSLVLTNYCIKLLIEIIVLPVTYRIARLLKRAEGVDTYDIGVRYSPLP
ncbi:MAG: queuosine precursor transporter [Treponema sp.]|nr:queuosine precursor transporter [Treponema sp.]